MKLSIILPCRNESLALPGCLKQIKEVIRKNNMDAEIIVSDSSTDNSAKIAKKQGVRVIKHDREGYGIAYLEAFKFAKGKYIFMADPDGTYDFNYIPEFLEYLENGYDLVIGDRFNGAMEKDAMPRLHKYIGNPVLSALFRLFFKSKIRDVHCGMRAISRDALNSLNLQTGGMEFASEMLIKATRDGLKIKEIPISYSKRIGKSKLKSFSDGWKHLRFMLLYSPLFLFLIPGLLMLFLGLESMVWLYFGNVELFGVRFYFHPLFVSSLFIILGYQLVIFSIFAKIYAITHLKEKSQFFDILFRYITIEKASIFGSICAAFGILVFIYIFLEWINSGLSSLNEIKNALVAMTFTIIGFQTIFSSFMLSILGIKEK